VPRAVLRAQASWQAAEVPGLSLAALLAHEGPRQVLPDGSMTLPGWTTVDASLRYQTRAGTTQLTWTAGIDNLFDRRYWKESPFQYGHVYLYPGAARTARFGLSARF
jgi:iron complex outermembrane receptor protein